MVIFALTLVRHGETGHNKDNVIQDVPLSETGLQQAEHLARHLQHQKYTHVFTSDLSRAAQTADIIMKRSQVDKGSLVKDERLRERKFGTVEGKSFKYLKQAAKEINDTPGSFTPSGGESVHQLRQRVMAFFKDLCQKMRDEEESNYQNVSSSVVVFEDSSERLVKQPSHSASTNRTDNVGERLAGAKRKREDSHSDCGFHDTACIATNNEDVPNSGQLRNEGLTNCPLNQVSELPISVVRENGNKLTDFQFPSILSKEGGHFEFPVGQVNDGNSPQKEKSSQSTKNLSIVSCAHTFPPPANVIVGAQGSSKASLTFKDSVIRSSLSPCTSNCDNCNCPNVSLSPLVEEQNNLTVSYLERRNSGCSSSDDMEDALPLMADVLIVTHGGWLKELIRHFVEDLGCVVPGGKKQAMRISPNTGLSRFTICFEKEDIKPRVICHQIHEKDHLIDILSDISGGLADVVAL
ncbi:fructose-2,6-bisphosphatase TIGAR-like isoform X2 [Limulus polyphemus]|uniref:Fructose-2,6-bisphosphatase TIGAR n=1 Tax=Limulus polyphemus TaxID=6850 RepID=A0ABM1T7F9_LIMPO|nr:fructose-2,6-bisphosphatase TIGAR-like isoform X2 [Limulus polyphemus]